VTPSRRHVNDPAYRSALPMKNPPLRWVFRCSARVHGMTLTPGWGPGAMGRRPSVADARAAHPCAGAVYENGVQGACRSIPRGDGLECDAVAQALPTAAHVVHAEVYADWDETCSSHAGERLWMGASRRRFMGGRPCTIAAVHGRRRRSGSSARLRDPLPVIGTPADLPWRSRASVGVRPGLLSKVRVRPARARHR
jgi:hypothetical protein